MTGDVYAYRASEEFAAAILGRLDEINRFKREVIVAWDKENPDTRSLWRKDGLSLDRECVGFDVEEGCDPEGLSRARTRRELIPRRGAAGAPWREALERLNQLPKMEPAFRDFGVDPLVWPDNPGNAIFKAGIDVTDDGVFVSWPVVNPQPAEHLTEVPLSVYYAAVEKRDQEKATVS